MAKLTITLSMDDGNQHFVEIHNFNPADLHPARRPFLHRCLASAYTTLASLCGEYDRGAEIANQLRDAGVSDADLEKF